MINRVMFLLAAFTVMPVNSSLAQDGPRDISGDERAVLVAAAEHVRSGMIESGALPPGLDMIVDPAIAADRIIPSPQGSAGSWNRDDLRAVAGSLGSRIGRVQAHYRCEKGGIPGYCSLHNVDALLSFGSPMIDGNRAEVMVRVVHRSDPAPDPTQAFVLQALLELEKEDGGWHVVGVKRRSVS